MDFLRFSDIDKKLLIKVIAGALLLATAFVFYLIKDHTDRQEQGITVSIESASDTSGELASPEAVQIATILVDVAGAVSNPSVVALDEGSRVFEAVEKAGGFTTEADLRVINQAEILSDGQKLYIPTKEEVAESQEESARSGTSSAAPVSTYQVPSYSWSSGNNQSKININTADSVTLQQLSGVGPSTAEKIIKYRNENGRFKTIEDIKNVSGIGDKTFEKFKDQITV